MKNKKLRNYHMLEETKETWQFVGFWINPGPEKEY